MIVGQPAQQRLGLGRRPGPLRAELGGHPQGLALHLRVVLDRDPDVGQHPPQVVLEPGHVVARAVDLDVHPRLGDLVVAAAVLARRADHLPQLPADVTADHQLGVDDVVAVQVVPGEFVRDRVDEERHVVGDDVDHAPRVLQRGGLTGGAHPHQGAALRAPGRDARMLGRDRARALRASRQQILRRDVPVVGLQIPLQVADADAVRARRLGGLGRLRQQGMCHLGRAFRHLFRLPCHPAGAPHRGRRPAPTGDPAAPTAAGSTAAVPVCAGRGHRSSRRCLTWCRSASPPSPRASPATVPPARRG